MEHWNWRVNTTAYAYSPLAAVARALAVPYMAGLGLMIQFLPTGTLIRCNVPGVARGGDGYSKNWPYIMQRTDNNLLFFFSANTILLVFSLNICLGNDSGQAVLLKMLFKRITCCCFFICKNKQTHLQFTAWVDLEMSNLAVCWHFWSLVRPSSNLFWRFNISPIVLLISDNSLNMRDAKSSFSSNLSLGIWNLSEEVYLDITTYLHHRQLAIVFVVAARRWFARLVR